MTMEIGTNLGYVKDPEDSSINQRQHPTNETNISRPKAKKKFIKNMVILCICTVLIFSSILALINAATSLLIKDNLGNVTLSILTSSQTISCFFLYGFLNKAFGFQKMITISIIFVFFWILAFFFPSLYLFIPLSLTAGFGVALVTDVFPYGTDAALWYHEQVGGDVDVLLVVVSGVVNACLGCGYICGNLLEYLILKLEVNGTLSANVDDPDVCGANFCYEDVTHLESMKPPDPRNYNILIGVFAAFALVAGLLSFFLEDFSVRLPKEKRTFSHFLKVVKTMAFLFKDSRTYLLVLITVFVGLEEAFLGSIFTHAFIDCSLGIAQIGNIMVVFGCTQTVTSLSQWLLVKHFNRSTPIAVAWVLFMGCFVTLLFSPSLGNKKTAYFVITAVWGMADSMIVPTAFSNFGLLFQDNLEESFSIATFWWSAGLMLCNATASLFCVKYKIYILIGIGTVGTMLFIYLEFLIKKGKVVIAVKQKTIPTD